ncbi:MAG: flagellar hook assembly protein FlgD [Burkholderiaceae bacterium]|jgi:flagellar basal-body rod modification protein FlgD
MATTLESLNLPGLTFYGGNATGTSGNAVDATSTSDLQSNFLRMLTVQLQNQDPMNPMESAEMTSQLAQLNMVDGIGSMNKNLTSLIAQMQAADFMSQAGTVGKSALVEGSEMSYDGQSLMVMASNFASPVTSAVANVYDAAGNLILKTEMGPQTSGIKHFYWDGIDSNGQQVAAGNYRVEVVGKDGEASKVAQTYVASPVVAVGRSGNDIRLTLADGREIASSGVVQWMAQ